MRKIIIFSIITVLFGCFSFEKAQANVNIYNNYNSNNIHRVKLHKYTNQRRYYRPYNYRNSGFWGFRPWFSTGIGRSFRFGRYGSVGGSIFVHI